MLEFLASGGGLDGEYVLYLYDINKNKCVVILTQKTRFPSNCRFSKFTKLLALHTGNFIKSLAFLGDPLNPRVKEAFRESTEIDSDFVNFLVQ